MVIQYYGDYCFKISTKPGGRATEDVIIYTDLLPKGAGLRSPQGTPQILLSTHKAPGGDFPKEMVHLDMPGEYSALGITFQGFSSFSDNQEGKKKGANTLFAFESEDIHIAFLGSLGQMPEPETLDKIAQTDILFVPIGGTNDELSTAEAVEIIRKLEPNIVIPMHFAMKGLTVDGIKDRKAFCEAFGVSGDTVQAKLTLKKKDIEEKQMEVIFLERGV